MSSKIKVLFLSLLMIFSSTIFVPNAHAANIVTKKADGSIHVKADAEHLRILNELIGTDITYKELMKRVFPEFISSSSPETLKAMDQPLSEIKRNKIKNNVQQNSSTSAKASTASGGLIITSVGSATSKGSGYVMHHSLTTTTAVVPNIATSSMLYNSTTGLYVNVEIEEGSYVNANGAAGSYTSPVTGNKYLTYGYHTVIYPPGYIIPSATYYSTSNTITY